jgi:hypothetical protein
MTKSNTARKITRANGQTGKVKLAAVEAPAGVMRWKAEQGEADE